MSVRNLLKGAGLTLGTLALLSIQPAPLAAAGPATANVCKDGASASASARTTGEHGKGRGSSRDHNEVAPGVLAKVNKHLSSVERQLRSLTAGLITPGDAGDTTGRATSGSNLRLANPTYINVYVHNIYGSHPGERDLGSPAVKNAIYRLSRDYTHGEAGYAPYTRFRFRLVSIILHRNDAFYHAEPGTAADSYWRKQYHRGDRNDLNIYLRAMDGGYGQNSGLLGYATFPWSGMAGSGLDSVNVHPESLPGRALTHYNEGDTLTHEVGHWMGLLHPFEGGCSSQNDGVSDTAPQQQLDGCPAPARTCALQAGLSNPGNYMQYTYDSCMVAFTKGQVSRMDAAWAAYRN